MELPSRERTFDFKHTGLLTGKEYTGRFTVLAVINVGQKLSLEHEKTRLLGNYVNPTDELIGLSIILSNLRARVVDAPDWWKQSRGGEIIDDEDVLVALYNKLKETEGQWTEELKKRTQALPDSPSSQP